MMHKQELRDSRSPPVVSSSSISNSSMTKIINNHQSVTCKTLSSSKETTSCRQPCLLAFGMVEYESLTVIK